MIGLREGQTNRSIKEAAAEHHQTMVASIEDPQPMLMHLMSLLIVSSQRGTEMQLLASLMINGVGS